MSRRNVKNLNIQFSLSGKNYNVALKEVGTSSLNKVTIAGIEYSLHGNSEGIEVAKKCIEKINVESVGNLFEIGKEIKVKLSLEGAKDISLSTLKETHTIGIRK